MITKGKIREIEHSKVFNIGNSLQIISVKTIGNMDRITGSSNITYPKV